MLHEYFLEQGVKKCTEPSCGAVSTNCAVRHWGYAAPEPLDSGFFNYFSSNFPHRVNPSAALLRIQKQGGKQYTLAAMQQHRRKQVRLITMGA